MNGGFFSRILKCKVILEYGSYQCIQEHLNTALLTQRKTQS